MDKLLGARQFAAALVLAQGALKTARGVAGAEKRVVQLDARVEAALLATLTDMELRSGCLINERHAGWLY